MEIILLERIARLGQIGDVVRVRDGYARNYLLPQGKALRANEVNSQRFEADRAQIEARNLERRQEAESVGAKVEGQSFTVIRQAGETGQLYGSVTNRDLAEIMESTGLSVSRGQINLPNPIKTIGMHQVGINMHADVTVSVTVNVARSEDEAKRQARGEDVTRPGSEFDEDEAAAEGEEAAGDGDVEAEVSEDDSGSSEDSEADETDEDTSSTG